MKRIEGFKLTKLNQFCLMSGMVYIGSSFVLVHAEDNALTAPIYAEFNADALAGSAKNVNLSEYSRGNPVVPGDYVLNVYMNGEWVGKQNFIFKRNESTNKVDSCFTYTQLVALGIDVSQIEVKNRKECLLLSEWIPDAFTRMNPNELRYDLSVPQAYVKKMPRGYVSPEIWDRGINAGFISYNLNSQKYVSYGESSTNTFLSLNTGLNLMGWQLRYNGNVNWTDDGSNYTSINTFAQRAFPSIRSVLTLGESYTSGEIFDSISYTGAQLKSDEQMLPTTMTGYAPVIRGFAQTNAIVEVRQLGQLINQYSVAPGPFVIDDLYPTGYGGNLDVIVREANGQIEQFSVPYAAVSEMLRPGLQRYSMTVGKVRNRSLLEEDHFVELTYKRGLSNRVTGYTGSIISNHYQAYQLGAAVGTPIGAISFDVTHSDTDLLQAGQKSKKGQSYKASYSKYILPTSTNFSLAAYRYSTAGYYSFQNATQAQDLSRRGYTEIYTGQERSQYQISVNQNLAENWGSFYLIGTWSDYWNNNYTNKSYQFGYSNQYKSLNYSVSAQKTTNAYGQSDDNYYLRLSFPLEIARRSVSVSQTIGNHSNSSSIFGNFNDDRTLSYNLNVSNIGYGDTSGSANLQYKNSYVTSSVFVGGGDHYHQYGGTLTGGLVGHAGGISLSPDRVETAVIVHANQAAGAKVNNAIGLKLDRWGNAVIPNVTPYRLNQITIDPEATVDKVELKSTSQDIAPYAGSITRVEFKTITGFPLLIKSKTQTGETLPFAADVYDEQGNVIGTVSQGSQIFVRTDKLQDTVLVKWGNNADQQCAVTYDLGQSKQDIQGYQFTEEQCK